MLSLVDLSGAILAGLVAALFAVGVWQIRRGPARNPMVVVGSSVGFCAASLMFLWMVVGYRILYTTPQVRLVREADAEKVVSIHVRALRDRPSPVTEPVSTTDPRVIAEVVALLRNTRPFVPNHPFAEWDCLLELEYDGAKGYCTVGYTQQQGTLVTVYSGPSHGWVLANLRSDGLGELLAGLSRSTQPPVPE